MHFHIPHSFHVYAGCSNHHDPQQADVEIMTGQRIETGTPEGDVLGFTEELFSGWLELKTGNRLYLHYVISRHRNKGNTQAMIHSWLDWGYDVRVVLPRPVMQHILEKFCFVPSFEYMPDHYGDTVKVWRKPGTTVAPGSVPEKPAMADVS
jgi:hypothetical protein